MNAVISGLAPRRKPTSWWQHVPSLAASLAPGLAFACGLVVLAARPGFAWLASPARWPWELWTIGVAGSAATVAGVCDWIYHRRAKITVGPRERRAELIALGLGGVPLFGLMAGATLSARPAYFLVPVMVTLVFTAVTIAYDEIVFHQRRCTGFETALHRVLVFGHAIAFAAWVSFTFVRGGYAA